MKIDEIKNKPLSVGNDKADAKSTGAAAKHAVGNTPGKSAPVENVTLSTMANQLKSLETSMATEDVYDANKVESIKNAIRDGQFKVNSEKVAEGLISTVKDLIHNN